MSRGSHVGIEETAKRDCTDFNLQSIDNEMTVLLLFRERDLKSSSVNLC